MKKNEQFLKQMREYSSDWLGKLVLVAAMIITVLAECVGLIMAIAFKNYLLLSVFSYVTVIVLMCYTKRVFFQKLNQRLLEREDLAMVMFIILPIITIFLSWNYFWAFILTVIIAFITVDFLKLVEVKE